MLPTTSSFLWVDMYSDCMCRCKIVTPSCSVGVYSYSFSTKEILCYCIFS